jgi:hypothetical protein
MMEQWLPQRSVYGRYHPLRQQYARECQAQDDAYRSRAQALHEKATLYGLTRPRPQSAPLRPNGTPSAPAKLAATLKRQPTFSEWCVTNKGRLEAEEMLRHDIDAQRNTMQQSKAQRIEYAKAHPEQAPQIARYDAAQLRDIAEQKPPAPEVARQRTAAEDAADLSAE